MAAGFASVHGLVRNVPRAAVNDQSRFHRNQDGKGVAVCLGDGPHESFTRRPGTERWLLVVDGDEADDFKFFLAGGGGAFDFLAPLAVEGGLTLWGRGGREARCRGGV